MKLRVRAMLPGDEPAPRPAGWKIVAAGIVVATLWATVTMLIEAREPPGYIRNALEEHGGTYAYPTDEVIVGLSVLYTEAILILALIRARSAFPLWARCAVLGITALPCSIVALGGTAVCGVLGFYQFGAGCWLLAVAASLVIIGLVKYVQLRRRSGY
jgi:hypothetical protein